MFDGNIDYELDDRRLSELHEAQSYRDYKRAKDFLRHSDKSGDIYPEDEENV